MKSKENDATGRKRRKIIYVYEKKLSNYKFAEKYSNHVIAMPTEFLAND